MQMHTEENENFSISEDVSIAGTSADRQSLAKPKCKRPRIQVRPNMSCGVNVSVNKIYYFSHIYRILEFLASKDQFC